MTKPLYLIIAESFLGLKEVPGKLHNRKITDWWVKLKTWFVDDETPWCGLFVAICLKDAGYPIPKTFYRALSWLDYGEPCAPAEGCIAIMKRQGGGHVAFVAGRTVAGKIILLGGNQGNMVKYIAVDQKDIEGYRKPIGDVLNRRLAVISVIDLDKNFA